MTNNIDPEIHAKSFAMESLMKNPKLAKVLFDAENAPLGSTRRASAANILKSIHRAGQNFSYAVNDGKGGMGGSGGSNFFNPTPSNIFGFGQSTLKIGSSNGMGVAPVEQPQNPIILKSVDNMIKQPTETPPAPVTQTSGSGQSLPSVMPSTTPAPKPYIQNPGSLDVYDRSGNWIDKNKAATIPNFWNQIEKTPTAPNTKLGLGTAQPEGTSTTGTTPSLSSDLQKYYSANAGGKAFAAGETSNMEELGVKLGMTPEVAKAWAEKMPSTFANPSAISDAVKKEYKLDSLYNKLMTGKAEEPLIKGDLSAYIRGKDEYLGQIDKMKSDFSTQMAKMDTSDPEVAKRAQNYMNYLTILGGRQNQRYVDYLNMAVDQWKAGLTSDEAIYNDTLKKVEDEIKNRTASYEEVKTMLSDMYDNVDKREKSQLEIEKAKIDILHTKAEIAKLAVDAANGGSQTAEQKNKAQIAQDVNELVGLWNSNHIIQGNGKLSSVDYQKGKNLWIQEGYTAEDFDNRFDGYIDKSGKNWLKDYGRDTGKVSSGLGFNDIP